MPVKNKAWEYEYRATTVCIDSYENGNPSGRLYNPYLQAGKSFMSLTQFLLQMEQILDAMDFPKSFAAVRTFATHPRQTQENEESGFRPGNTATFTVRILFRQNASWQGSVIWMEGKQEQSFRSVLELILLMDNALSYSKAS